MVKAEVQGVPNYGGIEFEAAPSRKPFHKALAVLAVASMLVVAVATISLSTAEAQEGSVLQSLAAAGSKKQPVKYGDTITLMNVYNNYMVVSANGRTFTGGYLGQNDRIRVVSPKGKSGQVRTENDCILDCLPKTVYRYNTVTPLPSLAKTTAISPHGTVPRLPAVQP
jgi:uncharacterized membrane protein YjgN (DUF898 family)